MISEGWWGKSIIDVSHVTQASSAKHLSVPLLSKFVSK